MDGMYYEHSGKYSIGGAIYALVVGSVIMCFCAFLYAYIILYCPLVYINAIVVLGFGVLVGYTCAALLKRKKVRNDGLAVALTLVLTSVAYYYGWVAWVWALARRADTAIAPISTFFVLLFNPAALWEAIVAINGAGAWSISKSVITGWQLWTVWGIELGLIFGLSLYSAYQTMDEEPFCETCEEWGTKKGRVVEAVATDLTEFKRRMEAKDFKYLEEAGAPKPETAEFQRIDVFSCAKCGSFHTLDSSQIKVKIESGKRKEQSTATLHHLLLTASEADALTKLGQKMNPPVAAKAAGASA
jgi:hypothetical protein